MKHPQPSQEWSDEVRALYRHDMREIWDRSIAPHIWNQYHNQLDEYVRWAGDTPIRILDVGCAQGTLALLLAELGHDVTAVDLRPAFLDYARSRYTHGQVRFLQLNALENEIPDQYDLIFANQLVEHLVYPADLLRRLHGNLRPGGRLVVTTPNGEYLCNRSPSFLELGDPAKWEHMQFTADGDGHFFAYLPEELADIFKASGFTDVRTRFFESPMISGHMKVRHIHRFTPAPVLRAFDRIVLSVPRVNRRLAHQLLVTGTAV